MNQVNTDNLWYQPDLDVFLNRWFSSYEDARKSLESEGGFLLPYKRHFFVCDSEAICAMGLEPDDADLEKIGWNCVQPADVQAYQRLSEKREKVVSENLG